MLHASTHLQGDAVLVSPAVAKVFINANDNPSGVLSFRPGPGGGVPVVQINEDTYDTAHFVVERRDGTFGSVSVTWRLSRVGGGGGAGVPPVSDDIGPVDGEFVLVGSFIGLSAI